MKLFAGNTCAVATMVSHALLFSAVAAVQLVDAEVAGASRGAATYGIKQPKTFKVSRVVDLLKDMKAQLEKEADSDAEVYGKMSCWCQTNDKEKTQAISDAEAKISQLGTSIEKSTALKETLSVEIDGLNKEINDNEKSLATATSIRERQSAEFTAEEKEMMQSIQALEAAIVVLSKHHSGAALLDDGRRTASSAVASQVSGGSMAMAERAAAKVAAETLRRHMSLFRGTVTPHQRRVVEALAQAAAPGDYFDATPTFRQAYTPQSAEIFGILRQMKDTFEENLSESQKEELEAQSAYAAVKQAKETEITTGRNSMADKKNQLAATEERLAQAKDERRDTEATLSADERFLMDLKQKCSMTDQEWEARQKTRQSELTAVTEAISILSSDDARDLFSRTFNPTASLLQFGARRQRRLATRLAAVATARRDRAAAVLQAVAAKVGDPKMSALASAVHLDAFTQVKKAIDDMVAELLKEADDELKHRDFCVDEFGKNERSTASKVHEKAKIESRVEELQTTIKGLNVTIETLMSEIAELEVQRQRAKEDRDLEKREFEGTVADQRETQNLLQQALDTLKTVYATAGKASSLVQHGTSKASAHYGPPPPGGFSDYEKSGKSGGVIALIEHIMADAKAMEAEAMASERQAIEMYQNFVQETQRSKEAKEQSIIGRRSDLSQAKQDLLQAQSELDGVTSELTSLSKDLVGLKGSCDFFLQNFEVRSQARNDEVEALRQAKAYLSGMQVAAGI